MKTALEKIAFAKEKIINVQTAVIHRFKVSLSFGNDHICLFQKDTWFFIDSRYPGASYVASVSDYFDKAGKTDFFGILHSGIIDDRIAADDYSNIQLGISLFQKFDRKLIQNDLSTVVCYIDKFFSRRKILKEKLVITF